jgi:hypothetical protein
MNRLRITTRRCTGGARGGASWRGGFRFKSSGLLEDIPEPVTGDFPRDIAGVQRKQLWRQLQGSHDWGD